MTTEDRDILRPIAHRLVLHAASQAANTPPYDNSDDRMKIQRGMEMLEEGRVQYVSGCWEVGSQHEKVAYRQVQGKCPCPSAKFSQHGRCKHRFALALRARASVYYATACWGSMADTDETGIVFGDVTTNRLWFLPLSYSGPIDMPIREVVASAVVFGGQLVTSNEVLA